MINANDNLKNRERRIEIDDWLEGGALDAAHLAAFNYARIHGIARIYDTTGDEA